MVAVLLFSFQLDWSRYFQELTPEEVHQFLTENSSVIVEQPDYLEALSAFLNESDPRDITNFLFLSAFSTYRALLPRLRTVNICVSETKNRMMHAASALYVGQHFQVVSEVLSMDLKGVGTAGASAGDV